jgi:hypothetical protein
LNQFEGFTQAKNPNLPQTNEDQIVVVPTIGFAVIDGATDITGKRFDDRLGSAATGGRLAAVAIAEALRTRLSAPAGLPAPEALIACASAAVADLYERLAMADIARASSDHRFRAGFVAAVSDGETLRLVKIGDCGIRVDGRAVLDKVFPGDVVLSAARALAFASLTRRGEDAAMARKAARTMIVQGLSPSAPEIDGLSQREIATIRMAAAQDRIVREALGGDEDRIVAILDAGLAGIRADTSGFDALVIDGVEDVAPAAQSLDLPDSAWSCIELHSDGYPAIPDGIGVAAWEAALAEADRIDPERVGVYRSTKGRVGGNFGDDRSIIVIRKENRA